MSKRQKRSQVDESRGPLGMIRSGDVLQRIVDRHILIADCQTISAILGINEDALPEAMYCLLHSTRHAGKSAIPDLCPDGVRGIFELLVSCGIAVGVQLAGEDKSKPAIWKN